MKKFFKSMLYAFGILSMVATTYAAVPTVLSITETSAPTSISLFDGSPYYDDTETIQFTVTFSEAVNVSGTPKLQFEARNLLEEATYSGGDGLDTLTFDYSVIPGINDWSGIQVVKFKFNAGDDIVDAATGADSVVEDFADVDFPNLLIDADTPDISSIVVTTEGENFLLGKNYLRDEAGDKITFKIVLANDDTRGTTVVTYDVGGTSKTRNFTASSGSNGEQNEYQRSTANGDLVGLNGDVSITAISFMDQAGKTATISVALPQTTNVVVDTTAPTASFTDDVDAGPVASETFAITAHDNIIAGAPSRGFSSDNVCDDNDTILTPYAVGDVITINDESHNGKWVCLKSKDFAGNITYLVSANPLNIDITPPVFDHVAIYSANPHDNNYGKADTVLSVNLYLANADSYDGNGNIKLTIGGVEYTTTTLSSTILPEMFVGTLDLSTIPANLNNESITVTGVNFKDAMGQDITGFVNPTTPSPTVIIDTQAPSVSSVISSTSGNLMWAKAGETVNVVVSFDEQIIRGNLNSATTANNISTLTHEFDISTYGTSDDIIFTAQNGDNGAVTFNNVDFTVVDRAGNITAVTAADLNIIPLGTTDTTKPTASNIVITSNNANDSKLAKTNDTIKIEFTTADNLSPEVYLRHRNPGWAYILGAGHGFTADSVSGTGAGQWVERFTDGSEQSEVEVPFRFVIRDEAGNYRAYKQTNLTGANVKFDRTNPIVQEVKISATSQDGTAYIGDAPTYYAKHGDTVDLEFQLCDYVDTNNVIQGALNTLSTPVVITDDGLTGVACTTPEGNPSQWRKWKAQWLNIDGTEGQVGFALIVVDNAGNWTLDFGGTTDGSRVIFDKTVPINPTDVLDALGAETLPFKHRSNAQFIWTNDADDTSNTIDEVSGVKDYNVRLENIDGDHRNERINSRNFDGRTSILTGGLIPPHYIINPYKLYIQTRDKAGNDAPEEVAYTQPYTIGFVGRVTDSEGHPIAGAMVQVVSRYGETCNLNQEVCTGVTNSNGEYSVLAQKDQDYNLTFFHPLYYLDKQEENLGHDDDKIINSVLNGLSSVHETQTANQGVEITTSELFVQEDGQNVATKIWVYSFSGEITYTQVGSDILVSSLSRITLVNSNNPAVQIINNGDNTYTIKGAGNVLNTHSLDNLEAIATGVSAFGTSANYSSGNARIGTKYVASNGSFGNTFGKYTTPQEWKEFGDRLRYGVKPEVLTYINRNGFEVFRGYRYGILGWDRPTMKRAQNQVKFRGISRRGMLTLDEDGEEVVSLAKKIHVMKDKFQKEFQAPEYKSDEFKEALQELKPLKRISRKNAYKGILTRNAQKSKVNKWERHSPFEGRIIKRDPYARNLKVIRLQLGNGRSVKIEKVMK